MKNYFKTSKWLRFAVAGAFGLMLVLNIMVSLDFDKDKLLPSLTLVELGNKAFAEGTECETGGLANKCCPYWNVTITYEWSGPVVSCTTGGEFKCDDNCDS